MSAKSGQIQSSERGTVSFCQTVGRDVLCQGTRAAYHGEVTDVYELVYRCQSADDHIVPQFHMARKGRAVGEDTVVSQNDIVSKVYVSHQEIAVADLCDRTAAFGTRVEQGKLADGIVVTDDQFHIFSGIFEILRDRTDGSMGEDTVVLPDGCTSFNDRM